MAGVRCLDVFDACNIIFSSGVAGDVSNSSDIVPPRLSQELFDSSDILFSSIDAGGVLDDVSVSVYLIPMDVSMYLMSHIIKLHRNEFIGILDACSTMYPPWWTQEMIRWHRILLGERRRCI